ncbi:hypothetical protein [Thermogutta sp.]|uniref:hypothetical protein n=1 Tax=Thermogutta sp. TaxID=1962930 RepID=UPI003220089C
MKARFRRVPMSFLILAGLGCTTLAGPSGEVGLRIACQWNPYEGRRNAVIWAKIHRVSFVLEGEGIRQLTLKGEVLPYSSACRENLAWVILHVVGGEDVLLSKEELYVDCDPKRLTGEQALLWIPTTAKRGQTHCSEATLDQGQPLVAISVRNGVNQPLEQLWVVGFAEDGAILPFGQVDPTTPVVFSKSELRNLGVAYIGFVPGECDYATAAAISVAEFQLDKPTRCDRLLRLGVHIFK